MADQKAIERGRALHRLLESEDFAVLLKEWDERIETLTRARDSFDESAMFPAFHLTRLHHRLQELTSLREWIAEEIEIGGRHKLKQEAEG